MATSVGEEEGRNEGGRGGGDIEGSPRRRRDNADEGKAEDSVGLDGGRREQRGTEEDKVGREGEEG